MAMKLRDKKAAPSRAHVKMPAAKRTRPDAAEIVRAVEVATQPKAAPEPVAPPPPAPEPAPAAGAFRKPLKNSKDTYGIHFMASGAFTQMLAEATEREGVSTRVLIARALQKAGYPVPEKDLNPPQAMTRKRVFSGEA